MSIRLENLSGIPGLSERLLAAFDAEARNIPGLRLVAGGGIGVRVVLKRAERGALSMDSVGRPVEQRLQLLAEVSSDILAAPLLLDTQELASSIYRPRRSASDVPTQEAALHSLARTILGILLEEGWNPSSNQPPKMEPRPSPSGVVDDG